MLHFSGLAEQLCTVIYKCFPHQVKSKDQLYRRRIYAEEKAKVVADVWGTELIQFLAALQI